MKVLIVEPEKTAYEAEIGNSLADMQKVVGGHIEATYPYQEPVVIVCNDEGKIAGLPLNRAVRDETGNITDIIAGTFFVCGLGEDDFSSLSPEQMEKFKKEFHDPELFMRVNGKIMAIKASEQDIQKGQSRGSKDHDR